ncbi:MAG: hypothetical protein KDI56_08535 [Xanthomonadales bacterium]|nr:hypothetical protein [Xanthomonadales bacterium]MCB1635094.1 hypothetical protein [Xanthomonadales bacterium]
MFAVSAASHDVRARTRILVYGLLAFVSLWILFGPSLAAASLEALGCSGSLSGCGRQTNALSAWLVPWLSARPPVETSFVLLTQSWPLLLVWSGLIALSMRSDRNRTAASDRDATAPIDESGTPSTAVPKVSDRTAWIEARQREQHAESQLREQTLRQRLRTEGVGLLNMVVAGWLLLAGLLAFCFAFGVPLLGGWSSEVLLGALGCDTPEGPGSACGFWMERLAPYRQPFVGALLSPVWLFTQFFDLLLLWLGLILLLALLPVYRLGSGILQWTEQRLAARAMFVLFVLSSAGLGYFLLFQAPTYRSAHPADPAPGVGLMLGLGDTLLALPLLSLIVLAMVGLAALSTWLIRKPAA